MQPVSKAKNNPLLQFCRHVARISYRRLHALTEIASYSSPANHFLTHYLPVRQALHQKKPRHRVPKNGFMAAPSMSPPLSKVATSAPARRKPPPILPSLPADAAARSWLLRRDSAGIAASAFHPAGGCQHGRTASLAVKLI